MPRAPIQELVLALIEAVTQFDSDIDVWTEPMVEAFRAAAQARSKRRPGERLFWRAIIEMARQTLEIRRLEREGDGDWEVTLDLSATTRSTGPTSRRSPSIAASARARRSGS